MQIYGEDIPAMKVIEKILISFLERFKLKLDVIEKTKDISKLIIHDLMGSLKSTEQKMFQHSERLVESVF